jgi:hypothetical protein
VVDYRVYRFLVTTNLPSNKASKNTQRRKAQISQLRAEGRALRKKLKSESDKVNRLKLENERVKLSGDKNAVSFDDLNHKLENFVVEYGSTMPVDGSDINQFTSLCRELYQLADEKKMV